MLLTDSGGDRGNGGSRDSTGNYHVVSSDEVAFNGDDRVEVDDELGNGKVGYKEDALMEMNDIRCSMTPTCILIVAAVMIALIVFVLHLSWSSPRSVERPLCPHTMTCSLNGVQGFGSQMNWLMVAALIAETYNRPFFIESSEFVYGPFDRVFISTNRSVTCDQRRHNVSLISADEFLDAHPVFTPFPLPNPNIADYYHVDVNNVGSRLPSCRICAGPDTSNISAFEHADYDTSSLTLTFKQNFLAGNGVMVDTHGRNESRWRWTLEYNGLNNINWRVESADYRRQQFADDIRPYRTPHFDTNDSAYSTPAHTLTASPLDDSRNTLSPDELQRIPPLLFTLKRRMMWHYMRIQEDLTAAARSLMFKWNIRSRIHPLQHMRELLDRNQLQLDLTEYSWLFTDQLRRNLHAARFISLHLRRGDKVKESALLSPKTFLEHIEGIIESDQRLTSSWPTYNDAAVRPSTCNMTSGGRIPHIFLMSDDITMFYHVRILRPCWRILHVQPLPKLIDVLDAAQVSDIPFISTMDELQQNSLLYERFEANVTSALSGWINSNTHVSEAQFNALPANVRRELFRSMALELMFVSTADYSLTTESSNLGRIIHLSRGWALNHDGRQHTITLDHQHRHTIKDWHWN